MLLWASLKEAPTQSLAYVGNRIWFLGGNSRAVACLKFITAEKGGRVGGPKEHSFTQYKSNFPGGLASSGMTLPPRTHTGWGSAVKEQKQKNTNGKHTRKAPQSVILNQGWLAGGWDFWTRQLKQKQNEGSQGPNRSSSLTHPVRQCFQPHILGRRLFWESAVCCDLDCICFHVKLEITLLTFDPDSPTREGNKAGKRSGFHFQESGT